MQKSVRGGFFAKFFTGGALVATPLFAQCALKVEPVHNFNVAYRERQDRCEGEYVEPVGASIDLRLVGFHAGGLPPDLQSYDLLPLQILHYDPNTNILLRAKSTRSRQRYQMDTRHIQPAGIFDWPTDILRDHSVQLTGPELALLACSDSCSSERPRTYWPVRAGNADPSSAIRYEVIVLSSIELDEVYVTIRRDGKVLRDRTPLKREYYPPDRPIRIPLTNLSAGTVDIDIVASSRANTMDRFSGTFVIP
jgi:hypothetical protein